MNLLKKSLSKLTAITLLVSASSAMALMDSKLGLQAGANFDNAQAPADISTKTRTGFTAGLNMDIPLATNISIQPELNYAWRTFGIEAAGAEAKVNYHSLEVPALLKLSFGEKVRPFLFAGPMFVWNIATDVQASSGSTTASVTFNPKTADLAGVAGAGLELEAFFVNLRYSVGFLEINENSAAWKSRGFKLLVGVKI